MSLIVDEHRGYLSDGVRLSAFARALAHHVMPQSIAADLGRGTGIFETDPPAARAQLRPDGAIVPSEISLSIFPVESPGMDERVRSWQTPRQGIDESIVDWAAAFVAQVTAACVRS